ncbi:alpha-amylase [Arthrobacter sp. CDRTa11]|uniref:alpha-amylase family protein n=1 Tax=Arthrobacter sp. CDRTa11 TaxID=2651199 RepID=UPI002265A102|nr:alpha-amylase family protein [Arthrobacter sp. CDRTa11]UZX04620.1 alpha-amylase [Arthrobacter sp. CDRTa11]
MAEPSWVQHAVWWHVYPLGFSGAEKEALPIGAAPEHGLRQLIPWLDYVLELGASGLALGPVFASETHGYDTTDYFRIDPRLGDDGDFDHLIHEAHARGIRVLLDGVFNHTGRLFQPFQDALKHGPSAPSATWFRINWPDKGALGHTPPDTEPDYEDFEGHHHLVALNHDEPQVAGFVAAVMKHWLDRGADGWRLDAAYAVPSGFWATVLADVRSSHPDAYFVGEYIHGDYAAEVGNGTLDSATQYELWKAAWSSLNDTNFYELASALERHNSFLNTFVPLTFVGNHDVTRIASKLKDPELLPHALVVLLTVGGTPSIYYGDEQAYRGVKEDREGGDDDVRPAFPASPSELSPLGEDVFRLHQELIGVRRRHNWLHTARTRVLALANGHLVYEATASQRTVEGRAGEGGGSEGGNVVVALNQTAQEAALEVPPSATVLLAGNGRLEGNSRVSLPAKGWAILSAGG